MNNGRASDSPAELFAAVSFGILLTELFPSDSFRVKQQGFVTDSFALNTSRDAHVGTWWFETVIVGTEWDPALFTKKLMIVERGYN